MALKGAAPVPSNTVAPIMATVWDGARVAAEHKRESAQTKARLDRFNRRDIQAGSTFIS